MLTCIRSSDDDDGKVTLSGLLNFVDGVWSAQSGERIIVLTTNFPGKLDPAVWADGHARRDVLLHLRGVQDASH